MFYYSRDRRGEHPQAHLDRYAGILQADAYDGYNQPYLAGRHPGPAAWLQIAAEGVPEAQLTYGRMLAEGRGVRPDLIPGLRVYPSRGAGYGRFAVEKRGQIGVKAGLFRGFVYGLFWGSCVDSLWRHAHDAVGKR